MHVVLRRTLDRLVPTAIVAAIAGALFSQTRHLGLLGFDAYPIIASSRVRSLTDLLGNFTEKLMDGRYAGDFYRPLLNLTFAADHAVWDLNAFGYQLTNALLLAACAAALWVMLRRLLGREAWVGPLTGLLLFLLSPVQWEVLPVPPRRGEYLCLAFMAIALAWQLTPRALGSRRPPWGPAVATLLAIASKETAFVLPALIGVAVLIHSGRETIRERLLHAVAASVPHAVVVAFMLLVRLVILGGLGGHGSFSAPGVLSLWRTMRHLLLPQPMMQTSLAYGLAVLLIVAGVSILVLRATRAGMETRRRSTRSLRVAVLAGTWVLLLSLIYQVGQIDAWYSLIPLAGWAMLAGALMDGMLVLVEDDDRVVRLVAMGALVLVTGAVVWQSSLSPVFRHYDEWERATRAGETYLEETRARVEASAPGTVVETPPLPFSIRAGEVRRFWGVVVLADYSVQAWADLALADRDVRVHHGGGAVTPPAADEIVLRIPRTTSID
jgi:hypothetical protein